MPVTRGVDKDALPPLVTRLPDGQDGQEEFGRLVRALLREYCIRARFQLRTAPDSIIAHGVPDFDGPVDFRLVWNTQSVTVSVLGDMLQKFGLFEEKGRTNPKAPRTHVVLVSPVDLSFSERTWLENRRVTPGFAVHHWGAERLLVLLHHSPPLLARYFPEAIPALFDPRHPANYQQAISQYRDKVSLVHRRVRLLGFPPEVLREQDAHSDIGLREIFVPLQFVADNDASARKKLVELFGDKLGIVVLADPGMGKSTLLTFLSLVVAGAAQLPGLAPVGRSFLPVLIPLRDYARAHQQDPTLGFIDYLALRARTDLSLPIMVPAFFEAALRMGEAVVFFDGLDEVGSVAAKHRISKAIVAFQQEYSRCRFFVTARIHGYTSDIALPCDSFEHVRIDALEDAQVDDFLQRWYGVQIPDNPREQTERKESLRRAIFRTPSVRHLAGNPLLLTLMAFIHRTLGQLPEDRCELYGRCVDMLLRSWQEAKGALEPDEVHPFERFGLKIHAQRDYLAYLALHIQQRNRGEQGDESRGLFPRDIALDVLTARHLIHARRDRPAITQLEAEEEIRIFLDYIVERTGLLVERRSGLLSFLHLSFQEYLAAWAYTCDPAAPEHDLPSFFAKHLDDPAWSEVLLLRLYIVLRGQGGGGERAFDAITSSLFRELERQPSKLGWLLLARALRDRLTFRANDRNQVLRALLEGWLEEPQFGGDWYNAVDELRVFGESVALAALRQIFADLQRNAPPRHAIATLHLEAKLFDVPANAAAQFRSRADLRELLPDFVAFLDQPAFAELLAEHATVDDWDAALEVLDSPAAYRMMLGWATGAVPCPVRGDAPLLAAVRLMRRKTATDGRLRTSFAERFAQSDAAALFRRPGRLAIQDRFGHIDAPLGAFVVPQENQVSDQCPVPVRRLLMGGFAYHRLDWLSKARSAIEEALARWPVGQACRLLGPFLGSASIAEATLEKFGRCFARHSIEGITNEVFLDGLMLMGIPFFGEDGFDVEARYGRLAREVAQTFSKASIASRIDPHGEMVNRSMGHGMIINDEFVSIFARELSPLFPLSYGTDFINGLSVHTGISMPSWGSRVPLLPEAESLARAALADPMKIPAMLADRQVWIMALTNYERQRKFDVDTMCMAVDFDLRNPICLPLLLARLPEIIAVQALFSLCRYLAIEDPEGTSALNAFTKWTQQEPIETHLVALAWEQHAEDIRNCLGHLHGAAGALAIAHAEYASVVTGTRLDGALWTRLLAEKDPSVDSLLAAPSSPAIPATLAVKVSSSKQDQPVHKPSDPPPLFTWLHLSDIHFGYPSARQQCDQRLVLAALRDDLAKLREHDIPAPNAIFVTGDIAWSGQAQQYTNANKWLEELCSVLGLGSDRIFAVPGNHDVDRSVDGDSAIKRLVRGLRNGDEDLDDALENADDRARLALRKKRYLDFVGKLAPSHGASAEDRMFWSHSFTLGDGYGLRLIGLDTAILAADESDQGKLRVGKKQIAHAIESSHDERTIVVVLGHHPLQDGWLHDQKDINATVRRFADVYLSGHVHDHESESIVSGGDTGLIRISAGAVHGDHQRDVPPSHGYNIASIGRERDGGVRLRVYPRRFSPKNGDFRTDAEAVRVGRVFAQFTISRIQSSKPNAR